MNYNYLKSHFDNLGLWFDVEIEWITTNILIVDDTIKLWFDVEIEWITTVNILNDFDLQLWFDVEIEWITTGVFSLFVGE